MANVIFVDAIDIGDMQHAFQAIYVPEAQPPIVLFLMSDTDKRSGVTNLGSGLANAPRQVDAAKASITQHGQWEAAIKKLQEVRSDNTVQDGGQGPDARSKTTPAG